MLTTPSESVVTADPSDQQQQEQSQEQSEDKKKSGDDSDESGVDASLGLINTVPVQLHGDLDEPITSGSDIFSESPGTTN
ncbi:MAG: hypothetical protein QOK41_1874 [Sphingomonadales bacterium]|nr:hypothetical protein [Sphingomonadales bacterium]